MAIDTSAADASPAGEALKPSASSKNGWITAFKVIVSFGAIAIVLWAVDLREALDQVSRQNVSLIAVAAAIMFIQLGFGAARWHFIRRGLGAPTRFAETFQLFYVGSFFSSYVLSAVSGDLMRSWLGYRTGSSVASAVSSVLLDRVVLICGLTVLMILATPWFFLRLDAGLAGWLPLLFGVGLVAGVLVAAQMHRLPERLRRFAPIRLLLTFCTAVRDVFMRPLTATPALLSAVAAQVTLAVATFALAKSMDMNVTLLDLVVLMQVVALINAIPISIGGWGVREAAMVGLLGMLGVPSSSALLLSVQLGLIGLAVNLPGGFVWLQLRSDAAARVKAEAT